LRPLRSPFVIWLLSSIFAGYSKLVFRTLRMTVEGEDQAEAVWAQGRETGAGAILCFWHSRIPMSPLSWPQDPSRRQDMRALISRSNDGEFIARTVEKLGFPSIRGSSAKKTDLAKNKHGEQGQRAGDQARGRLDDHEAQVQRRADREGAAEVLGRMAVPVMAVAMVVAVRMIMIVVIMVVIVVVRVSGVIVRHGPYIPPRACPFQMDSFEADQQAQSPTFGA